MRIHRKRDTLPYTTGVFTQFMVLAANCLISSQRFIDPLVTLQRPITKEY